MMRCGYFIELNSAWYWHLVVKVFEVANVEPSVLHPLESVYFTV